MINIGVVLDQEIAKRHSFLEPAGSLGSARINFRFTYPEGVLLNDQAIAILRHAYQQNSSNE